MTSRRRSRRPLPTRRISGPAELLQAIPYLLGFHPHQSLVLVGLADGRLVVTARVDLADVPRGVVSHTLEAFVRSGASSVLAVCYDDASATGASLAQVIGLVDAAADALGCELLDALHVGDGRWWSLTCDAVECCPPEGRELPNEPTAFAAAATYDGVVALPDRAALEAVLHPLPDDERERLDSAIAAAERAAVRQAVAGHAVRHERSVKRALFASARESDEPGWPAPSDDEVARFGAALSTTDVRDAVWMAVDDGRIDGRSLWRELGRRLPRPYDATPMFLYGWAAWRAGDGALARIAGERALVSDPGYSAADLLLAALSYGVDPRQVPKLRPARSA
jgi:hypothetical protein